MIEFIKYILYFEKARYYSGGALRYPVRITQKFWDEMQERKTYYAHQRERLKNGERHVFDRADTNYGSENADLGKRPVVPDWIVSLRSNIFFMQGVIGWTLILGYLLSKLFTP